MGTQDVAILSSLASSYSRLLRNCFVGCWSMDCHMFENCGWGIQVYAPTTVNNVCSVKY